MEDEKAKIRRNLVVFCAIYLGCAYLEIPMQLIANHAVFSKSEISIPAQKWLVVSTLVFLYLAARWFSSQEQRDYIAEWIEEFSKRLDSLFFQWVQRQFKKEQFGGSLTIASIEEKNSYQIWIESGRKKYSSFEVRCDITASHRLSPFTGRLALNVQMVTPTAQASPVLPLNVTVSLPLHSRAALLCNSSFYIAGRAAFWEWAPPFALVIITFGTLVVRWFSYHALRP